MRTEVKMALVVGAAVLFFAAVIFLAVREHERKERYKIEHDCHQTEDTKVVPIQTGKTTTYVTRHRWVCENGEELWD